MKLPPGCSTTSRGPLQARKMLPVPILWHPHEAASCVQHHYLGAYAREEDAARAYDIAVRKFRGKDAPTNLPPRPGRPPQAIKPTRTKKTSSSVKQVLIYPRQICLLDLLEPTIQPLLSLRTKFRPGRPPQAHLQEEDQLLCQAGVICPTAVLQKHQALGPGLALHIRNKHTEKEMLYFSEKQTLTFTPPPGRAPQAIKPHRTKKTSSSVKQVLSCPQRSPFLLFKSDEKDQPLCQAGADLAHQKTP